jgi:aminoglycoside phosphotransferase family enzyme/predicted kinase
MAVDVRADLDRGQERASMKGEAGDLSVAEQRVFFRAWLERKVGIASIRFVETHVSILGLSPDRVWKLKKSVRFPFIDLSTRALRMRNAEREVALNRRFAPDVYLGAVALDDDDGAVIDTLVEMRRMPDDRRLAAVVSRSNGRDCVERIADALVRIHRVSPSSDVVERAGSLEALTELWSRNLEELRPFTTSLLDAGQIASVADDAFRYLKGREPLFAQRIAQGRIVDGHGDLLADDVFCLDDGPRLLDCLEFNDQLRYGDVLSDIAFLAMDLERLGRRDLADHLLSRYRQLSADSWPTSLADFYVAYRAVVRSKVACLSVAADDSPASTAARTARRLLMIAAAHLAHGRVRLVLVGGAPATGKTTLARALAQRTGWSVVHSDEVRKRLAGLEPTTSAAAELDAGLYTPAWNRRTYDVMLQTARELLSRGESVILDASWSAGDRRDDAARAAASTSSALTSCLLTAPKDLADARARARTSEGVDASDASDALTGPLRERFAPWPDAIDLDATQSANVLAVRVLEALGHAPSPDPER